MTIPTPGPTSSEVFATKLLSTASIILGIGSIIASSWVGNGIALFWAVFAIITGIIALVQINKYRDKGKWISITGIALGAIFILSFLFKIIVIQAIYR
jgi:hypothetical protein